VVKDILPSASCGNLLHIDWRKKELVKQLYRTQLHPFERLVFSNQAESRVGVDPSSNLSTETHSVTTVDGSRLVNNLDSQHHPSPLRFRLPSSSASSLNPEVEQELKLEALESEGEQVETNPTINPVTATSGRRAVFPT